MKVNYKSDFELTIQLTAGGVDVVAPSWDWQLRFYTCDRQAVYTVAYIDGKAERCAVNTDGTITVYFDKHGLMPGALRCEFVNLVPDSHYTHDTQVQVDPVELGVELWRGASDGGMDAVTLELAGQVLAEVQALAADLQQKAESGYFDGEPGPQGPQGPPGPAGPGLLVVTVTGSDQEALTADHPAAEILAAHDAGRPVVAVYDGEVYQLASVGASLASFSLASADLEALAQIDVDGDGGAVRIFEEVQGALTAGDGITIDGLTISAPSAVPFVVTLTPSGESDVFTPDCTYADAVAADKAGRRVLFKLTEEGDAMSIDAHVFYFGDTASVILADFFESQLTTLYWPYDEATAVERIMTEIQPALTFDNAPTAGSSNPVKSGGVFTALQGKADTTALQNFCPLIEDTRTAEVSAITGIAPFSELKEGQRIMLHLAFVSKNNTTLTLTLSDGSTTPAIDVVISIGSQSLSLVMANILRLGGYYELVYDGVHWVVSGYDTNTIYSTMNQNNINTSHQQGQVVSAKLLVDNFDKRHLYVDNSADASVELSVATYNDLGTTDAPVVMLPASYTAADEFLYCFTCASDACVVTLPQGVVLADCCDDFSEVAAGVRFQVSIMDGVAAYLCVTPSNTEQS